MSDIDTAPPQLPEDTIGGAILAELRSISERLAAVELYAETARPLIGELAEAMPQLRQLAKIGEAMSQGGLGGLMAAMRAGG